MYINPGAVQYSTVSRNGITYVEAREVCVLYYMGRNYTREQSEQYIPACPSEVFRIYDEIQKEKTMPKYHHENALPLLNS